MKNTVGTMNLQTREAWLEKTLKNIPKDTSILDAGAGELQYKKFCNHLKYTSQDFAKYSGNNRNEGLQTGTWDNSALDIMSDIISIPVPDKSFDAIMCIEVLEHLPQPALAIKEFSRILRPGGQLIITAPFCSMTHFAPFYFGNGYSKYWYEKILNEFDFSIKELSYNGNYFQYLAQEIRRLDAIEYKYCGTELSNRLIFRKAKQIVLRYLNIISDRQNKSEELLCFGLHVVAKRN